MTAAASSDGATVIRPVKPGLGPSRLGQAEAVKPAQHAAAFPRSSDTTANSNVSHSNAANSPAARLGANGASVTGSASADREDAATASGAAKGFADDAAGTPASDSRHAEKSSTASAAQQGGSDAPVLPQAGASTASPPQTSPFAEHGLGMIKHALRRASDRRTLTLEHNVHKEFNNGDKYVGGWSNGLPERNGIYSWADGSEYDGEWHAGVKEGEGKYTWPGGAVYRGDWHDGCMHGHGTLEGSDGSIYTGGWQNDLKHGLGRKVYATGDVYEGLWNAGKPEGPGRYRWANSNEYDGEWRAGKMHGQGTLKWASGDRYDGKWEDGEQHGVGIFTWADGSSYNGYWRNGKKHGVGVFKPSPDVVERVKLSGPGSERHGTLAARVQPTAGEQAQPSREEGPAISEAAGCDDLPAHSGSQPGMAASGRSDSGRRDDTGRLPSALLRTYDDGVLIKEETIPTEQLEAVLGKTRSTVRRRERKARASKGPKRPGERIYKGHRSYDLMLDLQLGIRFSVGGNHARPSTPMLLPPDFTYAVKQFFPRDGSRATPPHPGSNFKWKDYCPAAFSKLRQTFGIDPADYMLSICGDKALRELPSPGKSGSVFFISHDERFFIKTMRKGEMELLLKLLPRYAAHIAQYPDTLLIKYLGLHRVKPANGGKVRFVVMNNLLRTDVVLHRKYDLKGSTLGRTAGPDSRSSAILKDLDVDMRLHLGPALFDRLKQQLAADCGLLEQLRVMDYSLLLGVHSRGGALSTSTPPATDREGEEDTELEDPESPGPRSPLSRWPSMVAAGRSMLTRAGSLGHGGHSRQASLDLQHFQGHLQMNGLSDEEPYSSGGEGGGGGGGGSGRHRSPHPPSDREITRLQQAIVHRFGDEVSKQRVDDLVTLASYKLMGQAAKAARAPETFAAEMPGLPAAAAEKVVAAEPAGGRRHHQPLGIKNPAVAHPDDSSATDDVYLYFGIIDILQEYNINKRVEHSFKSLIHDSNSISAVSPITYSRRFQDFLLKIFKPDPALQDGKRQHNSTAAVAATISDQAPLVIRT